MLQILNCSKNGANPESPTNRRNIFAKKIPVFLLVSTLAIMMQSCSLIYMAARGTKEGSVYDVTVEQAINIKGDERSTNVILTGGLYQTGQDEKARFRYSTGFGITNRLPNDTVLKTVFTGIGFETVPKPSRFQPYLGMDLGYGFAFDKKIEEHYLFVKPELGFRFFFTDHVGLSVSVGYRLGYVLDGKTESLGSTNGGIVPSAGLTIAF